MGQALEIFACTKASVAKSFACQVFACRLTLQWVTVREALGSRWAGCNVMHERFVLICVWFHTGILLCSLHPVQWFWVLSFLITSFKQGCELFCIPCYVNPLPVCLFPMQLNIPSYLSPIYAICCREQRSLCCRRAVGASYLCANQG